MDERFRPKGTLSFALGGLADVALVNGDIEAANSKLPRGPCHRLEGNFPLGIVFNLMGLVRLGCCTSGAGAGGAGGGDGGRPRRDDPGTAAGGDNGIRISVASVRAALGDAAFTAARAAGASALWTQP